MRYARLHYFDAARADPDGEIAGHHTPQTPFIPLVIKAARDRNSAIEILSTDYQTKDCTAVRDYVNVCHLATARGKAVDRLLALGTSASINLGIDRGHSVVDIRSSAAFPRTMNQLAAIRTTKA
jgi:UDP-arabinose 4-epimerase